MASAPAPCVDENVGSLFFPYSHKFIINVVVLAQESNKKLYFSLFDISTQANLFLSIWDLLFFLVTVFKPDTQKGRETNPVYHLSSFGKERPCYLSFRNTPLFNQ
jgi:hypothetical protein